MIILDKPYISDFLQETLTLNKIPVLDNGFAKNFPASAKWNLITEENALSNFKNNSNFSIYTNSENSINWIINKLNFTDLPKKINLFKDKVKFRHLVKEIYPNFFYAEVNFNEIDNLNYENLPKPFVIKPSVGFFSLGVYTVSNEKNWIEVKEKIKREVDSIENLYPVEVLNTAKYIIEEYIKGEEFAFDAYYDNDGNPVILSILKHLFSSGEDVSDRVYITSKEIIETYKELFDDFLNKIGKLSNLKNFPLHVEVRLDDKNNLQPIEINPIRFGGWCTTSDLMYLAYNFNPYEYYFSKIIPDWNELLKNKDEVLYSIVVLNDSTGIDKRKIKDFNYEKLIGSFENVLELRKVDINKYPLFGFVFTETRKNNFRELEKILVSDLREYLLLK